MRARIVALMLLPLLVAAADEAPSTPFDPRRDPRYGDARPALRLMLGEEEPRPRAPQHFCIIGYRWPGGSHAWVHWREGRKLILWEGSGDPAYPPDSIARSRQPLDLTTDVVLTPADIGSSTYLIDRSWLARTLADCRAHGARYVVTAPRRPADRVSPSPAP